MPSLCHDEEIHNIVYVGAGECEKIVNLRWEQIYRQKEQVESLTRFRGSTVGVEYVEAFMLGRNIF